MKSSLEFNYKPQGVCSRRIDITLREDGVIESVRFTGGCDGNTKGLAALCRGQRAEGVIGRLSGIRCGFKETSCPNELTLALEEALEELPGYEFTGAAPASTVSKASGKVFRYQPKGVCSRAIELSLTEEGTVDFIRFIGGCPGNTQGVAALCRGRRAEEVIECLSGIRCGLRKTSCPNELTKALAEAGSLSV